MIVAWADGAETLVSCQSRWTMAQWSQQKTGRHDAVECKPSPKK